MPVKSNPFGRVEISGEDATRFLEQVHNSKPNKNLIKTAKRIKEEYDKRKEGKMNEQVRSMSANMRKQEKTIKNVIKGLNVLVKYREKKEDYIKALRYQQIILEIESGMDWKDYWDEYEKCPCCVGYGVI